MWNPEWARAETAGAGPVKEQRSRSAGVLSGVKFRAGLERRGSRRTGEGFQVSRQVEGSQHAGIAEIMSGEASFVPQLFFDSERGESERKRVREAGGPPPLPMGPPSSKPLAPPAPGSWPERGHSLAFRGLSIRPSVNPSIKNKYSLDAYCLFSRPRALEMKWWRNTAYNPLGPGLPFPGSPHLMSWLYLARRSERHGAPVLI